MRGVSAAIERFMNAIMNVEFVFILDSHGGERGSQRSKYAAGENQVVGFGLRPRICCR